MHITSIYSMYIYMSSLITLANSHFNFRQTSFCYSIYKRLLQATLNTRNFLVTLMIYCVSLWWCTKTSSPILTFLGFGGWTTAACARRSDSYQFVFTLCLHQRVVAGQCDCITACSFNPFPCIRSMCRQCAKRLKPPTCKRETPSSQPSSRKSRP